MGGSESTTRKVSFGLDEAQRVVIIQGIKLSADVLHRMRDSEGSTHSVKSPKPDDLKPAPDPKPASISSETQDELRKRFEKEHALVQEQLARLAQREREAMLTGPGAPQEREAMLTGPGAPQEREAMLLGPGAPQEAPATAVLRERARMQDQQDKTHQLAKQLERKEAELQLLSSFYKEQLLFLEKKSLDQYKQVSEQYNQAVTRTEAHIQPRPCGSVCPELQSQVLQCYRENTQQTLRCSSLAQAYMSCIHSAKKNLLINHG